MARFRHFCRRSVLAAPAEQVWRHALSADGINDEMFPWLRMSLPAGALPAQLTQGLALGRCWLWLFGLLPVECDRLFLRRLRPLAYDECSTMLSQRRWIHRRRVLPRGGQCIVIDRVGFVPRLPLSAGVLLPLIVAFFAWRHRRLLRRFGAGECP